MSDICVEEWFIQYASQVHNYLVYFTRNRDVDDLVQETFLRAIRHKDSYQNVATPYTWLVCIARRVAIDHHRRLRRHRLSFVELVNDDFPTNDHSPEYVAELSEVRTELLQTVEKMKANYREVIILRLFLDMSVRECAHILGWSESKVKVTQLRALKKLRTNLISPTEGEQHAY